MPNKSYYEIRNTSKLISYEHKFAAKCALWIETYQDDTYEYHALFTPSSTSLLPNTITKIKLNDFS